MVLEKQSLSYFLRDWSGEITLAFRLPGRKRKVAPGTVVIIDGEPLKLSSAFVTDRVCYATARKAA